MNKKRLRYLTFLVLICLAGGTFLIGCAQQEEPEPVEEIVETVPPEVETMEEEVESEEVEEGETEEMPPPPAEIPAWCDGGTDLRVTLEPLEGETPEGITVEVCLPGGLNDYTIETHGLAEGLLNQAKDLRDTFPIAVLMGYFEVFSVDPYQQVFSFDPALNLRIIYAAGTWEQALEEGEAGALGHPRAAYLVLKENNLSGDWVEFNLENMIVIEPGTEGYPEGTGALIIQIETLPDPLIGGC